VSNFDIQKIHNTVWVFKNALKSPEATLDYLDKKVEWKDWYIFGKHAEGTHFTTRFDSFPTPEQWEEAKNIYDHDFGACGPFESEINDVFYNATKEYVEANNVSIDNWIFSGWNIAKYEPRQNEINGGDYAMAFHTDYQREFAYNPGHKFAVTAVFYLNDNYSGGDVLFRFLDNDDVSVIKEEYNYKPQAGDLVIFNSGHPHYHGVKIVSEGEKYIIRTYWRYDYPGHPLWKRLQEKYGEDIWKQMEDERLRYNRNSDNIDIINGVPFWQDFESYYEKEIESLG